MIPRGQVGSLLWMGLSGPTLTPVERERAGTWHPSGAVLFRHNLQSLQQTHALLADLQAASPELAFVAVDQEGGRVTRLPAPATRFPSAMALAASGDEGLAEAAATATGRELRAFGATVNLAPVLDVHTNAGNPSVGTRSLGDRAELVARFGAAQVRGYLAGGVLPVGKHFPGKGDTPVDPHLALGVMREPLATIRARALPPYRAARDAGLPAVMIGHLAFSNLDPEIVPSTLSAPVYRLLRDEVPFDRLALTDALRMKAVADRWGLPRAGVLALNVGANVLMPLADEDDVLQEVERALASGELSMERFEASRARLDEARRTLASLPDTRPEDVRWDEHAALALDIARRALTLVRDERGWLPLQPDAGTLVIEFDVDVVSEVEEGALPSALLPHIQRFDARARGVVLRAGGGDQRAREAALDLARSAHQVVLATREAHLFPAQAELANRVLALGRPTVVASLRSPFEIAALADPPTFLAVCADVPASLQAAAEALFGVVQPSGHLPVHLPGVPVAVPAR